MSGDIIKFRGKESRIFECPCGCHQFFFHENGDIECCGCNEISQVLKGYLLGDDDE